jgi:TolA-binding protein
VLEFLGTENDLIKLFTVGATMYCRGKEVARCVQNLRDAASERPASAYSPQISWLLASALSWEGLSFEPRERLRQQVLEEFYERWPDHALMPGVLATLVDVHRRAGNDVKARKFENEFASRYPRRRHVIEALRSEGRGEHQ